MTQDRNQMNLTTFSNYNVSEESPKNKIFSAKKYLKNETESIQKAKKQGIV